jgi:hypothetical protein
VSTTVADVTRRLGLLRLWRIETFRPEQLTERDRKLGRIIGIAIVAIMSVAAARQGALTYREKSCARIAHDRASSVPMR